ncbi:uncharacterized protein LOC131649389 [Vicia villosa]|uniref:uncharacterized protein LOC131649389 n=1 Tax=Vicia villosa TaxID=3911 RepID=UPI00273BAC62|nr:uncharacterized protein LOC131649389 [Vicia villosa]
MANYNFVWSSPKLTAELDFSYRELLMTTHLNAHNVWSFVDPGLQLGDDDVARRRDQLALSQIHQGIYYSIFGKIANAKTAKETWDILKLSRKGVEKAQKSKLQSLHREDERYEMSNSEIVEHYFSRIINLVNKIRVYGEDITDSKVVEKILRAMLMKFDHLMTTIIESHDTDTLSVAELQVSIEIHYNRILEMTEKVVKEEALKSQVNFNNISKSSHILKERGQNTFNRGRGNYRGRGRGNYGGRGRGNLNQWRDNNFNPSNQGRGGNNFGYNNRGQRNNFRFNNRGRGRGNYNQERTNCSCYHCGKFGHKAADCRYRHQTNVAESLYQNTGRIAIRLKDGTQNFIDDVFYAHGLHHNLLSMGQLSEKGYNMQIHNGFCT